MSVRVVGSVMLNVPAPTSSSVLVPPPPSMTSPVLSVLLVAMMMSLPAPASIVSGPVVR
jgi:hypothetical protein